MGLWGLKLNRRLELLYSLQVDSSFIEAEHSDWLMKSASLKWRLVGCMPVGEDRVHRGGSITWKQTIGIDLEPELKS